MDLKALLDSLELDGIVGIDYETFWAKDYTLLGLPTSEYIYDERFKTHCCSVQWHSEKKAHVLNPEEMRDWASQVDWRHTGLLAHHTHFDGLIASKHFDIHPAFLFDTLSMARPIMPITVGGSLMALCAAFNRVSKKRSAVLLNTKGIRNLDRKQYKQMAAYAGDDIGDCWFLFNKFLPYTSLREFIIMDRTIRMFTEPRLRFNETMLRKLYDDEVAKKAAILKALRTTKTALRSKEGLADLLRDEGVKPPMKLNKKQEPIYAFAKTDLAFKALLGHKKKRVRELVRGRLAISTNIMEKRAQRYLKRAPWGAQPVYLNYALALTLRWTGGDKSNYQNLKRGSELREAIEAPDGHELIIVDSSQIEARLNARFAGQMDKVEQFRKQDKFGREEDDVYAMTASKIFGREIIKSRDPGERFIGKVCDLQLGYQAGAPRYAHGLRTGVAGQVVDIADDDAKMHVSGWRHANQFIVAGWRETNNLVNAAFIGKTKVEHRFGVVYEGRGDHGYMHLPNGMSIRYAEVECDEDGGISYLRRLKKKKDGETRKRTRLYGGLLVENRTQALSRVLLADWIVAISTEFPDLQLVMTTHDEVVFVAKIGRGAKVKKRIIEIMTTPPDWMPDLPLNVDWKVSRIYEKG